MTDAALLNTPTSATDAPQFSVTRERLFVVGLYVVSILVALVACGVLVAATGGPILGKKGVVNALLDGALRKPGRWGHTLGVAVPLALVALGTAISGRAGLINIGQEGQLTVGSAVSIYTAVNMAGPGQVALVTMLAVGFLGGALWAGIAAALLYWRRVPEVLTTLLLTTVAAQAVGYALNKRWLLLAPIEGRSSRNIVTEEVPNDARFPFINAFGNKTSSTVILTVVAALALSLMLARSVWGFRLRTLGQNRRTAQRAGVSEWTYGMGALMLSGGFAGLAGAVMLAGGEFGQYRMTAGFAVGIGFDGLLVCLVARQKPLVILIMAFVFAALRQGSSFLAATQVPREITDIVKALLTLALLVPPAILHIRERRRALAAITTRT
jgi:simple sugar transport system permease protein